VRKSLKKAYLSILVAVGICIIEACQHHPAQPAGEEYIHQKIPIEIERGKAITVEIRLSGSAANDVGIRCSPETWQTLTNSANGIAVALKSSTKTGTQIYGADVKFGGGYFLGYVTNVHYLFEISGKRHAKASVEITFPTAPPGVTHAEIIVGKTPEDTEAPF
jgi:hypothetical protein